MGLYKIEGVVLRRRNLGEADRLVTVLSRDRGKLTVVAKGARKPRSRLGGRLEPPTRFRALMAEGRSLDVISQVEVLDAHAALRCDLDRMSGAAIVLELADRALADRQAHPDVFRLLLETLSLIRDGAGEIASLWFAARLLVLTGHRPAVRQCVVCRRRLQGPVAWSPVLGGCVHVTCGSRDPRAAPVPRSVVALLAFLLDAQGPAVRRVEPPEVDRTLAAELLHASAEACWETRLRAPEIAGRLRAVAPSERRAGIVASGKT
jgi:DNA repair protein RecO (recombination protein O)